MKVQKSAIGTVVAVVVLIIIVAAVAGAYYFLSAPSGGTSTSSSTSHTSSSTSHTSTVSTTPTTSTSSAGSTTSTSTPGGSTSSTTTSQATSSTSTTPSSTSTTTTSATSTATSTTSETSFTSTETSTCTSTFSTTTTTGTGGLTSFNFAPLLGNFSAMTVEFTGLFGGTSSSFNSTFTRLYASATTFKVNATTVEPGNTFSTIAWVLRNGTVIAAEESFGGVPQNLTGLSGSGIFLGAMSGFFVELEYGTYLNAFSSASQISPINSTSVMIGPTSVQVTNYGIQSLPTTITYCGDSFTFSAFALQTGTATGSSFPLITLFNYQGSETVNGQNSNVDFTFKITSIGT